MVGYYTLVQNVNRKQPVVAHTFQAYRYEQSITDVLEQLFCISIHSTNIIFLSYSSKLLSLNQLTGYLIFTNNTLDFRFGIHLFVIHLLEQLFCRQDSAFHNLCEKIKSFQILNFSHANLYTQICYTDYSSVMRKVMASHGKCVVAYYCAYSS